MIFTMSLLASLFLLLGVYVLCQEPGRAGFKLSVVQVWIRNTVLVAKWLGRGLVLLSFGMFIFLYGLGAGGLFATILWMVYTSLIIILLPMKRSGKL